jgi:hypothetical protein
MAAVANDRFRAPSGLHDRRVLAWTRARADDALAGRTVWCAAALPAGRRAARRLRALLQGDLAVRPLAVTEIGADAAERQIGGRIAPGDVVILHDALTVSLARPLRERGAHAIWDLRTPGRSRSPGVRAAQAFLDPYAAAVDAFVLTWEGPREGIERIAALVPASDLVDVKDVTLGVDVSAQGMALAWSSILGDVLEVDRSDHVGGTLSVRPSVAPR